MQGGGDGLANEVDVICKVGGLANELDVICKGGVANQTGVICKGAGATLQMQWTSLDVDWDGAGAIQCFLEISQGGFQEQEFPQGWGDGVRWDRGLGWTGMGLGPPSGPLPANLKSLQFAVTSR